MVEKSSSRTGMKAAAGRRLPSRRDVLAGATAALASTAAVKPAGAAAPVEGYFLVFEKVGNNAGADRLFFIPSEWLEVFDVTEAYQQGFPGNWNLGISKIRNLNPNHARSAKISALYADSLDPGIVSANTLPLISPELEPGKTYLAQMVAPDDVP